MRLAWRLSLVAVLLLTGCNKKAPAPVPVVAQPSSSTLALQMATREFAAANYPAASREFERYLQLVPSGEDGDQALFHLGLIYSLPDPGWQDWPRANGYLTRLIRDYPQSSYKPAAELILSMKEQAAQLSSEIAKLDAEAKELRTEVANLRTETESLRTDAAQLRMSSAQLNEQLAKAKTETDQLTMELEKKEQRIRQLSTELDRLIRIDSERRR